MVSSIKDEAKTRHRKRALPVSNVVALGRRRTLWLGFLAVFLPLSVMLVLQYRWLVELQHKSTIARHVTLANYLEYIAKYVEYYYTKAAALSLNVGSTSPGLNNEELLKLLKTKSAKGVKLYFVLSFEGPDAWRPQFFNPHTQTLADSVDINAKYLRILTISPRLAEGGEFGVDENDPDNRVICNPLLNEDRKPVGLVGMIVDERFFAQILLPMAIKKVLAGLTEEGHLVVTVYDEKGRAVIADPYGEEPKAKVRRKFSYIFKDWEMGIYSRYMTPEQWARTNFILNMTLSLILGAALIGGILLALRTAFRAMRLSEMKNDFVSNVSHELRTPLASIRAFGELLRRGKASAPAKVMEYGEYIETESRRLSRLIENILNFAKIESGQKLYQLEQLAVRPIVERVLKSFEVRMRHCHIRVALQEPERSLSPVNMDADAIAHALANLLDNAVKYSNGGENITVSLREADGMVAIAVTDKGIGISREEKKRIFERFHRVGTGLIHDIKGSGLGLSIVLHIVSAHGGRVEVESELGKGSTFSMYLPVAKPARSVLPAEKGEVGSENPISG